MYSVAWDALEPSLEENTMAGWRGGSADAGLGKEGEGLTANDSVDTDDFAEDDAEGRGASQCVAYDGHRSECRTDEIRFLAVILGVRTPAPRIEEPVIQIPLSNRVRRMGSASAEDSPRCASAKSVRRGRASSRGEVCRQPRQSSRRRQS